MPFVGRERELSELRTGLEEGSRGRGQLFVVSGEAGIGKTRLAEVLAESARERGSRVFWASSWEGGGAPDFWPWRQLLRAALGRRPRPKERAGRTVALAAPSARIATFLDEGAPPTPDRGDARFQLFDAVATFWKSAAERRPIVLVLEDLHWADRGSILLLDFLARQLHGARLLVLATCRSTGGDSDVARLIGEVTRAGRHIPLAGLAEPELHRLVREELDWKPSDAVVNALHRATAGNPFFVWEVLRQLAPAGCPDSAAAVERAMPEGARQAIDRRLAPLSADARQVLSAASVIGGDVEVDLLRRITAVEYPRLLSALDELASASLLARAPHDPGTRRFTHPLVRAAVYDSLEGPRRVALHARIVDALEPLAEAGRRLAEIAEHAYAAALGGEDAAKAIDYLGLAGDASLRALAYEEAGARYEKALRVLESHRPDDRGRLRLLLGIAEAWGRAGEAERSKEAFRGAAALARSLRDPQAMARAAMGHALRFGWEEIGSVDPAVVSLLEEALELLGTEESALRAVAMARLAAELYNSPLRERKESLSEQAVALAERVGDGAALAYALLNRHLNLSRRGTIENRLAIADRVVRVAEKAGEAELALRGRLIAIADALESGDARRAENDQRALEEQAPRLRQPFFLWQMTVVQVMRATIEGRFEDAEALAAKAKALGERGQGRNARAVCGGQMRILRLLQQGRLTELGAGARSLADAYRSPLPFDRALRARVLIEIGRADEARALITELAHGDFAGLPDDDCLLGALGLIAEVAAALEEKGAAEATYRALLPFAGSNAVIGPGVACYRSVDHFLGLLAARLERFEDAVRHLESAHAAAVRLGAHAFLPATGVELAEALAARGAPGDAERAAHFAHEAGEVAQNLGVDAIVTRAAALLATLSRSAPESPPERSVFRREGDYWVIRYAGQSARLPDRRGLAYLARLLAHRGVEFHALDLVDLDRQPARPGRVPPSDRPVERARGEPAGDVLLDSRARQDYGERLRDLRGELEELERLGDLGRAERVRGEMEFLAGELNRAVGLGGRDRRAASAAERARVAVTKRIKATIREIAERHAPLGSHLERSIRTGVFCRYDPGPGEPIDWEL